MTKRLAGKRGTLDIANTRYERLNGARTGVPEGAARWTT